MSDSDQFNAEKAEAGAADQPEMSHEISELSQEPPEGSQESSDLELFEKYLEEDLDYDLPGRGDLREGVIVEIRPSELLVNVGSKRDGVVSQSDLARLDPEYVKSLSEGQTVDVVISRQPDDEGIFVLSMADALQQRDWITAQELLENGAISAHTVVGFNKGGLTVEFNHLRGFVPASHVVDMPRNLSEDQRRAELEGRIGRTMRLKVIEVERRRRRLVMSESLAEREYQAKRREELFTTISVGDVIEGEVRSLRPFGAFVDVGGADGLLHVSEIGWSPIGHPRDVLEVGEKVEVQVIRVDPDSQRIALSRKRLLPNPWDTVDERYHPGDIVPIVITRVVDFGAFAQLEPGIEGLIHISELADIAVAEPLKTVKVGDKVQVKVLRVDGRRQRVGLSLRQVLYMGESVAEIEDSSTPAEADVTVEVEESSTSAEADVTVEVEESSTTAEADVTVESGEITADIDAEPRDLEADVGAESAEIETGDKSEPAEVEEEDTEPAGIDEESTAEDTLRDG